MSSDSDDSDGSGDAEKDDVEKGNSTGSGWGGFFGPGRGNSKVR